MLRIDSLRGSGQKSTAGNSLRSDIRPSFFLSASTARRCAKGSGKLQANEVKKTSESICDSQLVFFLPVFGPRVERREAQRRRVSEACLGAASLSECRQSGATIVRFLGLYPFDVSIALSPRTAPA